MKNDFLPRVDGVLLLDKPTGISSNAAIQYVKRLLRAGKVGHVGTLDPLASGLLPVCFGEATKFSTGAFGADKSYDAEILLGVTTNTGDTEGLVTSRNAVSVAETQIGVALRQFVGAIEQTPPMYSALKRAGKPLYAYARAGVTLNLQPRSITIHSIAFRRYAAERLHISVHCSKGTYVRVLAEDIGRVLGCGATLAGLRRTSVAEFNVGAAVTFERLEGAAEEQRLACLLPVDSLVLSLPELRLDPGQSQRLLTGQANYLDLDATGLIRLYDREQRFLGLGQIADGGVLVAKRLVSTLAMDINRAGNTLLQAPKIA